MMVLRGAQAASHEDRQRRGGWLAQLAGSVALGTLLALLLAMAFLSVASGMGP